MKWEQVIFVCCVTGLCLACSPHAIREARNVVAQADSLWQAGQMYGVDAGDSATLAQAYETLGAIPLLFREGLGLGSSYARSCYHYGRLLREKDNPVEAMQVFINATHSHTRDYHTLGRVYSNMGSICHLAGDFPLSYDMYEKSAQVFLQGGDTLSYYYLLNDMAFELAEQKEEQKTLSQLAEIESACTDSNIKNKILETKAVLYLKCKQYDSALYYASDLCLKSNHYPIAKLIKAQVYSYWGIKDSAVYYAEQVLRCSSNLSDIHNALYILTNDDEKKDINEIRKTAAERSDVQFVIRTRKARLAQAAQLLKQNINRKPNLSWLYAIIATLLIIGATTTLYVFSKSKKHQLLSQQIDDLEFKNKTKIEQMKRQIVERCFIFANSSNIKEDLCWNDYDMMCNIVNQHFGLLVLKLQQTYDLSEREIRLCVLSLFNISYDSMAEMLYYSPNGIGKFKLRVAQKLGTTAKNLQQFLIEKVMEN